MFKTNLKSKLIIAVMVIFGITAFTSCEKTDLIKEDTPTIFRKKVTNQALISSFKSKVGMLKSTGQTKFNTDNIYEVGIDQNAPKALIAEEIGFDENNEVNYSISMAVDSNGNVSKPVMIKTENINSDIKIISYYDNNSNILLALELNNNEKRINVLYKKPVLKSKSGDYMVACIQDAYTKHGWISVWAFVQSAILPETAVAIAADCYIHYLFE